MPMYSYECQDCEERFEASAKIEERNNPQECPACTSMNSMKVIDAVGLNFPGDGWISKNLRIAKQMKEKNKRLAGRERDWKKAGMVPSLVPNVGGERVDSWSEATKLAKSKGKDTSGYEKMARKTALTD